MSAEVIDLLRWSDDGGPAPRRGPVALQTLPRWSTWRYGRDDKKIPAVNVNEPEKWGSYTEAQAHRNGGGIGFLLGEGISGLDLDKCRDPQTGEVQARAQWIIDEARAAGAYVEESPSGKGYKIFGRSALAPREINFEDRGSHPVIALFEGARYFAVTESGEGDATVDITDLLAGWLPEETKDRPGQRQGIPEESGEGGRNDLLYRLGCRYRRFGYDEADLVRKLREENARRCHPPLPESEIETIARSCMRHEPAADPFKTTETGDAEFFASCMADQVRFDHRRGRWLVFDGSRWAPQSDGEVDRLALEAVRARQRAAVGDKERLKWAIGGEGRKRRGNLLALAQSVKPIAEAGDDWDTDPWLLGVRNGVVDLRTGELREGRPEDRITMQASVSFSPDATCPTWDKTLKDIFGGDEELMSYFDRFVGYSITGDCREEVLAFCWGDGANGKGTVMNTIARILGDYSDDLPFSALELHERSGIPNDIAKIVGKRFVTSSESGEARRLNEARVKALTGRDPITARFLQREFFTFQPMAKFWLASNHKPVVRDTSAGFWRRMHLIPFTQSFAEKPDLELKDKLMAEAEGILARLVRGCMAWQRNGLNPPARVKDATETYRTESSPLGRFLDARCVLQADAKATFGELHDAYQLWCGKVREFSPLNRRQFGDALHKQFTKDETNTQRVAFIGVGLLVEERRDDF
jgi:putative DNA primase/helicase